ISLQETFTLTLRFYAQTSDSPDLTLLQKDFDVLSTQQSNQMRVINGSMESFTGLASWVFGYPFLTSAFTHVHWPVVGEFELASAMVFDTGVYITVVGATLVILSNLGKLAQTSYDLPSDPQEDTPWKP